MCSARHAEAGHLALLGPAGREPQVHCGHSGQWNKFHCFQPKMFKTINLLSDERFFSPDWAWWRRQSAGRPRGARPAVLAAGQHRGQEAGRCDRVHQVTRS